FKIGGLAAGAGTKAAGIHASSRLHATIRNCSLRGFVRGISFGGSGSGGHLIEDNTIDGNTRFGVYVTASPNSTIRNNQILDTGGSSIVGHAYAIFLGHGVEVMNNSMNGVAPPTGSNAYGMRTVENGG